MNPIHSHLRNMLAASAALVLACHSTQAFVTNVTETFDTGLGRFDAAVGNTSNGNNFGFSNSTNAGGTAGEIGGTFSQGAPGYVADTTLGGTLTKADPLVIKAKAYSLNGGNDQWAGLGYFTYTGTNTDASRGNLMAGIVFIQGATYSRGVLVVNGDWGAPFQLTHDTFDIDLALRYDPGEDKLYLEGTVDGQSVSRYTWYSTMTRTADAFGVISAYGNGGAPSATAYFDNLQYSTVYLPPGTVTETFDTGLGRFDAAVGNTSNGNNFGFSNSSNAGGAAGEIGGTFSQGAPAYVADTTLGGTLTKADPLVIKAKAYSLNGGNDQHAGLGYFTYTGNNTDATRTSLMAGIVFIQGATYSRGLLVLNGDWGAPFQLSHNTFDIDLRLRHDPGEDKLYLEGTVDGQSVSRYTWYSTMTRTANAFGVISAYGNGGVPSATAYFDNIQYFALPPALTTNVFTSSPNPSGTGSNVTFTATIQTNGVTATAATGTVEFRTNGVAFGSATLSSGLATLTTNALPHGSNMVLAAYLGDAHFVGSTNSLVQVVNTPPVAKAITNGAPAGATSTICIIGGKPGMAPTDADNDALLISQVENPSALLGATVTTDGTNIFYTPGLNASGADTVQYVVSDGFGGYGTNKMYVTVSGQSYNIVSGPTFTNNQFRVSFAGIPGYTYAVDDSTTSASGPWAFFTNLTAGINGLFQLVATNNPPAAQRFFRTRYQP